MTLDPRIILAGQSPDVVGSMARGIQAAGMQNKIGRENALAGVFAEHGPGIVQGDPNALGALARHDPMAAFNIDRTRRADAETSRANQEKLRLAQEAGARAAAEIARKVSNEDRERLKAGFERAANMLATASSPEGFASLLAMPGVREDIEAILGPGAATFENREAILAAATSAKDALATFGSGDVRPITVSPGQTVIDPRTGQVVFEAPPKPANDPAAEQKIARLMEGGLPREIAVGIVDGRLRVSDGRVLDVATGEVVTAGVPAAPAPDMPATEGPREPGLYSRADDGTGLFSALGAGISATAGQLPGALGRAFTAEDMVSARQAFLQAQNDLVRAISINPRFPVAEMQMIRSELGIKPGVLNSPADTRTRMRELDTYLRRRAEVERRAAADATLPRSTRDDAARAVTDIDNFLNILGVPQGDQETGGAAPTAPPTDGAGRFSGATLEDLGSINLDDLSDDEINLFNLRMKALLNVGN